MVVVKEEDDDNEERILGLDIDISGDKADITLKHNSALAERFTETNADEVMTTLIRGIGVQQPKEAGFLDRPCAFGLSVQRSQVQGGG